MRSEPGALSGLSCLITCLSSMRMQAFRFSDCWVVLQVLFRLFLPSVFPSMSYDCFVYTQFQSDFFTDVDVTQNTPYQKFYPVAA
jgi:hypothetical protein